MASSTLSILPLIFFCTLFWSAAYGDAAHELANEVAIADVESNTEVQELGQFAVNEYNRFIRRYDMDPALIFDRVLEAKSQVVSGVKYNLRIATYADEQKEKPRTFNAIVVVTPALRTKQLVTFIPVNTKI